MEVIKETLTLDPNMIKVGIWLLAFLFASLVSIIVWLAKHVWAKLETISNKQDANQNQIAIMTQTVTSLDSEVTAVYKKLEHLPTLISKIETVEIMVIRIDKEVTIIKNENSEIKKELSRINTQVELHKQWISLRGNNIA